MYEILLKYLPKDKRIRMLILMAADVLAIYLASFVGLFIRFDMSVAKIPLEYSEAAANYLPYYILATLLVFFLSRMYSTMWSVAGAREVLHIVGACALASLIQIAGMMASGASGAQKLFSDLLCVSLCRGTYHPVFPSGTVVVILCPQEQKNSSGKQAGHDRGGRYLRCGYLTGDEYQPVHTRPCRMLCR